MGKASSLGAMVNTIVDVVADYGADPTYTNDSTSAFQAALTALETNSNYRGGTIRIPAGHYKLTGTLVVTSYNYLFNIFFEGNGPNNTVLDFTGIGGTNDGIKFDATAGSGGAHFGAKNLTITNATGNGINIIGTGNFVEQFVFENLRIQQSGLSGIKSANAYMGTFNSIWCWGSGSHGFEFDGYHTSISCVRCWGGGSAAYPSGGNNLHGWSLVNMTYSSFVSCGADFNTDNGYYCKDLRGVSFVSCGTESNVKEGWFVTTLSTGTQMAMDECFGYLNSTGGVGTYANFVGCLSAGALPIDLMIDGGTSQSNAAGDVHIVGNGSSGTVTIHSDGLRTLVGTTLSVMAGTATLTDSSGTWDNIFLDTSVGTSIGLTATVVPFTVISGNVTGNWNSGSSYYTVASTGVYQISSSLRVTSTAAGDAFGLLLYINGSRYADGISTTAQGNGNPLPSTISLPVAMTAGQTIQVQAVSAGHAMTLTAIATNNFLSISRIA